MRRGAGVLELDGQVDYVLVDVDLRDPDRVALQVGARPGRTVLGRQVAVRLGLERVLERCVGAAGDHRGGDEGDDHSQADEQAATHGWLTKDSRWRSNPNQPLRRFAPPPHKWGGSAPWINPSGASRHLPINGDARPLGPAPPALRPTSS